MGANCTAEDKNGFCSNSGCCEAETIDVPVPIENTASSDTSRVVGTNNAELSEQDIGFKESAYESTTPYLVLPSTSRQVSPLSPLVLVVPNGSAHEGASASNGFAEKPVISLPVAEERPNFSGKWKCTAIGGDWDAFLTARGLNFVKRKGFKALGYGVNSMRYIIDHVGDLFKITIVTSGFKVSNDIRLGAGEQDWNDGDAGVILTYPQWSGATLVMSFQKKKPKAPFYVASHYLEDGKMVVKSHMPNGSFVVFTYFTREA